MRCILQSLLLFVLFFSAPLPALAQIGQGMETEQGGMIEWPLDEMDRALDYFIEKRMEELDVPGLSLVVIADGKAIIEKGYGVASAADQRPVTQHTLFEAASLGLPVQAYGALRLARENRLPLDAPLSRKLSERWLPNGDAHASVTLRHVLTHTSGLNNWAYHGFRGVSAAPGERFRYSGTGFIYLAHVMEAQEEVPFERWMREHVFQPLGMSSSGYTVPDVLVDSVLRGHHALWVPVISFALPMLGAFLLFSFLTFIVVRFGLHRLRLELGDFLPALILAPVVSSILVYVLRGGWALIFCIGYFLAWLFIIGLALALLHYLRFIIVKGRHDGIISRSGGRRFTLSPLIMMIVLVGGIFMLSWQVPAPLRDGDDFNPALSFRTSAHDLGHFAVGVLDAEIIGTEWRDMIMRERVELFRARQGVYGWGLGFGTHEQAGRIMLWQQSSYMGTQGLMVIDPSRRAAAIILLNADKGAPLAQELASHILGVEGPWLLP